MKVIGITGGVGAGKSAVLHYIEEHYKARLMISDEIAHELMEPGTNCYEELKHLFAPDVFQKNGQIDRLKMAKAIFSNEKTRLDLNAIVHPAVRQYLKEEVAKERAQGKWNYVIIEAAIFENEKTDKLCDETWYIRTSDECRTKRLMENRGYSKEKVENIISSQLNEEAFRNSCDVIINNDEDFDNTIQQIKRALG